MPQTSVGTIGVAIVNQNAGRKSIFFRNGSSSGTISLDNMQPQAITTTTAGIKLGPGSSIAVIAMLDGTDQLQDSWSAIADATCTLEWKEFHGGPFYEEELLKLLKQMQKASGV